MIPLRQTIQGLRPMARPVRGRIALSVLIGAVRIAASLGFVWICKRLVDIATGEVDAPLSLHIGILLGIMMLQLVCSVAASAWESYNSVRSGNELRRDTFARVLRSSWTGREAYRSGDAVNRLEEDVRVVTELLCTRIPDVVITVVQLLAASVYLLLMAPNLLWVLIVLMVAAVGGSRLFFKKLRVLTERIRKQDAEIQQLMQENLQKRLVVLTLIGAERVLARLGGLQKDLQGQTVTRIRYNAVARGCMIFYNNLNSNNEYKLAVKAIAKDGTEFYSSALSELTAFSVTKDGTEFIDEDYGSYVTSFINIAGTYYVSKVNGSDFVPDDAIETLKMVVNANGTAEYVLNGKTTSTRLFNNGDTYTSRDTKKVTVLPFDFSGPVLFVMTLVGFLSVFVALDLSKKKNLGSVIKAALCTFAVLLSGALYIYSIMATEDALHNGFEIESYSTMFDTNCLISIVVVCIAMASSLAGLILSFINYDRTYEKVDR